MNSAYLILLILLIALFSSCTSDENKPDWVLSQSKAIAINQSRDDTTIVRVLESDGSYIEFTFFGLNFHRLRNAKLINKHQFEISSMRFPELDTLKVLTIVDEDTGDEIEYTKFISGLERFEYYSLIPQPYLKLKRTFFFDIKNNDTLNKFYYQKSDEGFRIITDISKYANNSEEIDSSIIYASDPKSVRTYSNPENGFYIPDFNEDNIVVVKNSLLIPTKHNELVAQYWLFPKDNKNGQIYRLLIMRDDFMDKIENSLNKLNGFDNIHPDFTKNELFVDMLVGSGLFEFKNGKLVIKD